MGRALLAIGGGRLQLPALRWARAAGLHLVVTDQDPNAPGRKLADRFDVISGTDVDALLELARDVDAVHDLVGAYSPHDFGLPAVAAIGAALGKPAASPEAVARCLDKAAATRALRAAGIPTPEGTTVADETELMDALQRIGTPAIVKPADSSGSRGVRAVTTAEEALRAFDEALHHSRHVVLERQLHGHHVDVNGFFREGAFLPGGLLDRFFTPAPVCVPTWGLQPSRLTPQQADATYRLVDRAARALGVDAGPVKADVVWTDDGPVLLELAPRFHGDVSTAHVSPLSLARSPIQAWFATLAGVGGPFDVVPTRAERVAGWMAILPEAAGTLRRVRGVEAARAVPGVDDVLIHRSPGYTIPTLGDNRAVCGFVWASGDSAQRVEERLRRACALLHAEVETPWPSVA